MYLVKPKLTKLAFTILGLTLNNKAPNNNNILRKRTRNLRKRALQFKANSS
jgi:hypothetical protein